MVLSKRILAVEICSSVGQTKASSDDNYALSIEYLLKYIFCFFFPIFDRDKRELMLFFHTLKSSLPVDVQFTSDTPIEQMEEAIKQCVTSMNKELQHMQKITGLACSTVDRGMNQQERDGEGSEGSRMEMGDGSDNSSHEEERIQRLREEFLKQQQSSKSKDCTLASNQAESLRVKLVELRGNTDTAVTVLSRCI